MPVDLINPKEHSPFGPKDVRTICARFLQASMLRTTASSTPEKCLWPSLSIDWSP